jgi:hypothetical protein
MRFARPCLTDDHVDPGTGRAHPAHHGLLIDIQLGMLSQHLVKDVREDLGDAGVLPCDGAVDQFVFHRDQAGGGVPMLSGRADDPDDLPLVVTQAHHISGQLSDRGQEHMDAWVGE